VPIVSRGLTTLASLALVLWLLWWLQPVLVPVALATLFTFLLGPLVTMMERRRVPRAAAVTTTVVLALALLTALTVLVTRQVTGLVDMLPQYESTLIGRIATIRDGGTGLLDRLQTTVAHVNAELKRREVEEKAPPVPAADPLPVRVIPADDPFRLSMLWSVLGPALAPFATAGLTLVLVIFMLFRREDLRDRLITLVGRRQLSLTTRALDEASERISRYLLLQLAVNAGFGLATTLGLWLIGIPYAPLWGFLAGVLRYIPYLGAWLGALLPIGMSILVTPGWSEPLLVVALFLVIEFVANMLIEPWLYGRGIGVSQPATLVMIAFWTWLWGPVGLVLATPLTVCLVVLGKYVPALKSLDVALSDQPALDPPFAFYQRLLAHDEDEALMIAEEHVATLAEAATVAAKRAAEDAPEGEAPPVDRALDDALAGTCDAVVVRALVLLQRDGDRGEVDRDDEAFALTATRSIVAHLHDGLQAHDLRKDAAPAEATQAPTASSVPRARVIGVAAQAGAGEVGLHMLGALLDPAAFDLEILPATMLASEVIERVAAEPEAIVCICSVHPRGTGKARLIAMRLAARVPQVRVVMAALGWPPDQSAPHAELAEGRGVSVATTLAATTAALGTLRTLAPASASAAATSTPSGRLSRIAAP
jgi:predicted PurR-regulated permease PerM